MALASVQIQGLTAMTTDHDHSGEITYVLQQLADLYTPEQAQQWLTTPHAMLGGRSGTELINEGKVDEVLRVINQLRDGSHL
jgi:uncharacterized protein (DUF2384 family)